MFCGIGGVGIEDIFDIGLAVFEIQSLDFGHGSEKTDDGLVGIDIGHGLLRVSGMRMHAELSVDKTLDAGLEAVFETVITGGDAVINCAAGQVSMCVDESVHLGMNYEIILHRTLGEGHFGFVGTLH